jgi:hypothetical protein
MFFCNSLGMIFFSSLNIYKRVDLKPLFGKNKVYVLCQVLVAHTCNPSFSGSREQEDHGSKPALG